MSDAITSSEADAIPRHCTRCDYALAGLPAEGICPECGAAYDGRFLILRGHAIAGGPPAARSRKFVWLIAAAFAFNGANNAWQALRHVRSGNGWQAVGDLALVALWIGFIAQLMYRRFGTSGPPGELWLCAEGFAIRASGDASPAAPAEPVRHGRLLVGIVSVACAATAAALFALRSTLAVIPLLIAGFLAAIALATRDAQRRVPLLREVTPLGFAWPLSVVAWRRGSTVAIDATPKDAAAFALRIVTPSAPAPRAKSPRDARFVAALDASQARHVRRRVDDWIAVAGGAE